jgi:hypothetical protein
VTLTECNCGNKTEYNLRTLKSWAQSKVPTTKTAAAATTKITTIITKTVTKQQKGINL